MAKKTQQSEDIVQPSTPSSKNAVTSNRDNFLQSVRRVVATRAHYRCSFPGCTNITVGPSQESESAVAYTGVAAHIHAASPGGKRYIESMTTEQRSSINNAIWLCGYHGTLIDQDDQQYPADLLRTWKSEHEARIAAEQRGTSLSGVSDSTSPLNYTVEIDYEDGWDLVLEGSLPQHETSMPHFNAYKWLLEQGAASYLETCLRLFVRNTSERDVAVIFGMRQEIEHGEPFSGTKINSESAGDNSFTVICFDLDQINPRPMPYSSNLDNIGTIDTSSPPVRFFRDNYITIEGSTVHGFRIIGRATNRLARWRLIIDYEVRGVTHSLVVDNNGNPFLTSGEPTTSFRDELSWAWWRKEGPRFQPFGSYSD